MSIVVRGSIDARALAQLMRCAEAGDAMAAALCADSHVGYSQPIGGVVAYRDYISPSGVGYDIGCGNKAVRTNLFYPDVRTNLPKIMDEIYRRISFGIGRVNNEPCPELATPILDKIRTEAPIAGVQALHSKAVAQIGTVGSGNHYVDLFRDETDHVWIGVHFGSRGFGHGVASGFLALAQGLPFDGRAKDGEMDSPPVLLHVDSALAHLYIESMRLAGEYASTGRDIVCAKVLEILGAQGNIEVHNHHNFAWHEEHFGEKVWVVRKGCTPAFPGQQGFVGATMGEPSVILEGVDGPDSPSLLYSTVHGAGRVMSRTQALGRARNRWTCADCGWIQRPGEPGAIAQVTQKISGETLSGVGHGATCPECGRPGITRERIQEIPGLIDFKAAKQDLKTKGIELRGGAADEAPGAYKRLSEVLAAHEGTIKILHHLRPIGVAMAAPKTRDPYKD